MILFSLTRWMETVLYSQMFYAIFQFCAELKFASLDGNIATDVTFACFFFFLKKTSF